MKKQLLLLIALVTFGSGALQASPTHDLYEHLNGDNINEDQVARLLWNGAQPWTITEDAEEAPIHIAAKKGLTNIVAEFIEHMQIKSINCDVPSLNGWTALNYAAAAGQADTVKSLVEYGADINYGLDGWTALHSAAVTGGADTVKLLVECGADIDAQSTQELYTPLHLAVFYGNCATTEQLVALGADRYIEDHSGKIAFSYTRRASNEFPGDREALFENREALGTLLTQEN